MVYLLMCSPRSVTDLLSYAKESFRKVLRTSDKYYAEKNNCFSLQGVVKEVLTVCFKIAAGLELC